jgi:hypothetical protein
MVGPFADKARLLESSSQGRATLTGSDSAGMGRRATPLLFMGGKAKPKKRTAAVQERPANFPLACT